MIQETELKDYPYKKVPVYRKKAVSLSVIAMGLGQIYNKQYIKGILLFVIHLFSLYTIIFQLPHALWGLTTLGEQETHLEKIGKIYENVIGDHSIFLMVEGLITIFMLIIIVCIYVMNIKDAYHIGTLREYGVISNNFGQTIKNVLDNKFPQIILSIPMLGIFFFTVLPIIFMILIGFTNYTRETMPPAHLIDWHGFKTFFNIFKIKAWSSTFYEVTLWTFTWAIFATLTCFIGGFAVALLVQTKDIKFKKVWRTLFILPFSIPMFVSTLILKNMFNGQFGPINQYLKLMGLSPIPWLSDPMWAKVTIILVNFWLGFPITMLMIIGILTTISKDMYEAAEIDGATAIQKLRLITCPSVMITMAPILLMQFIANINNFNVIYLMTNGKPTNADFMFAGHTDILITWLFNLSMNVGQYNFASVIGTFIFIGLSIFAIFNLRRTRVFKEEDLH